MSATLLDLLNFLIELITRVEGQLWKIRASRYPEFDGSASIARRLDLPALVEYVFLDQMNPEGLRGLFSTYTVSPDLAERCRDEFRRRVGREIETKDFDRSRLYWKQYGRENGKPAYVPIGLDSIRTSLSLADVAAGAPSTLQSEQHEDERPAPMMAEAIAADRVDDEIREEAAQLVSSGVQRPIDVLLRDDWHEFLLPKGPPMRPQVKLDPAVEPAWKADWHRVVLQRAPND